MEANARMFNCARCHKQRVICSCCDHGHRYCGPACAQAARRSSQRAAGARYQRTRPGRFTHALRQQRYRERQQKVTHQGFVAEPPAVSLPPSTTTVAVQTKSGSVVPTPMYVCHFCGMRCSSVLRRGWLRSAAEARSITRRVPRPSG